MEHTKGKWKIDKDAMGNPAHIVCGETIVIEHFLGGNCDLHEDRANAKRICLTNNYFDDLLDACKNVLNDKIDLGSLKGLVEEIESKK